MAKLLKLRRGTTSQHSSFTGAEGEVTVDTTKDTIVVHDGSTAGGTPLAKESAVTAIPAVIDEDNMSSDSATRPPSQQSVKAYVDAIPDVIDEDSMSSDSATRPPSQQSVRVYVQNQTVGKANISGQEFQGVVGLKGSDQLKFYDDDDSNYVHVKSPTALTGNTTYVLPVDDGSAGQLLKTDGSGNLSWTTDSTLTLLDEDNFASDSATKPPSQQSVKAYIQTVSAADALTYATKASPTFTGDVTLTGVNYNVVFDASDNALEFADNAKATFGGSLSIYHNGSHSYIDDLDTGELHIRSDQINFNKYTGEALARFRADGNCELFHDNSSRLTTTSTGIDVTGTAVTDGLTVAGTQTLDGTSTQTVETLSAASTITIDCSTGNFFTLTAGQNTTFAFSNIPASGNAYVLVLQVAVATYSLTWPSAVKWSSTTGGSAPTLTANKVNNFVLVTSDGGTTWRGSANTDYAS